MKPIPAWRWMLTALAAVVITAFVVTIWLLTIASHAKPGTDQANARLNAVRTGLAAGAGAGAAVGLVLAFRRQHHQEIATTWTDQDATERRITELYTKAVEQLGSEKAPVRLGGLYALERLAQDNPAHRQTIVNVICAYLRMPFSPKPPTSKPEPEATEDSGEPAAEPETSIEALGDTWQQERQVRLAAQRILAEHLRDDRHLRDYSFGVEPSTEPPSPHFWPGIRLDLVGATLIDFNLDIGVVADARFDRATFSGNTSFLGTRFSGGYAWFSAATFSGTADFAWATFSGARFDRATFSSDAGFGGVNFGGSARFSAATFHGRAFFAEATFNTKTALILFGGGTRFDGTNFSGDTSFAKATFDGGEDSLSFEGSRVPSPDAQHVWPKGWCLGPDGSGGYTVVRANGDSRS